MTTAQAVSLSELFEQDETAWLEITAKSIWTGRLEEVDYRNLAAYLADIARRDRRLVHCAPYRPAGLRSWRS
jgi:hypothetical protein